MHDCLDLVRGFISRGSRRFTAIGLFKPGLAFTGLPANFSTLNGVYKLNDLFFQKLIPRDRIPREEKSFKLGRGLADGLSGQSAFVCQPPS